MLHTRTHTHTHTHSHTHTQDMMRREAERKENLRVQAMVAAMRANPDSLRELQAKHRAPKQEVCVCALCVCVLLSVKKWTPCCAHSFTCVKFIFLHTPYTLTHTLRTPTQVTLDSIKMKRKLDKADERAKARRKYK
jgi:hypothetical protein